MITLHYHYHDTPRAQYHQKRTLHITNPLHPPPKQQHWQLRTNEITK